ncbi:CGNR zinc finger domain-containing protein [Nocardia sp. NPDC087230]|uniref:CGNR zinc finger domain-containing protein n=1 Tax=unclassified Nocardia TaxID=2637762 RepID=UPI00319DE110
MGDGSEAALAVIAFANTHADGGGGVEQFADADGLRTWLRGTGRQVTGAVTDADAAEARQLRDAVVTILLTHSADPNVSAVAIEESEALLRRAADRYPLRATIDRDGVELRPIADGVSAVLAAILAAVTELAYTGSWSRLKACRNPPCHFAFYDRTRNTSAAYCSNACSSQVSMRAIRARRRAQATDADADTQS